MNGKPGLILTKEKSDLKDVKKKPWKRKEAAKKEEKKVFWSKMRREEVYLNGWKLVLGEAKSKWRGRPMMTQK